MKTYFAEAGLIKVSGRNYTLSAPFLENPKKNLVSLLNDVFILIKSGKFYIHNSQHKNKPNGIHLISKVRGRCILK